MVDSYLERKVPDRPRNPEMRQGSTGAGYAIDKRGSASSMSTLSRPQPALLRAAAATRKASLISPSPFTLGVASHTPVWTPRLALQEIFQQS